MSNTILNNLGGDNAMSNLSFKWVAKFKNIAPIYQFEKQIGKEHKFQEVKDNFTELISFTLYSDKQAFTVDLINGLLLSNNIVIEKDLLHKTKNNIRLIFFRRHRVELTEKLLPKSDTIIYFLGYQYIDQQGINRKILMQLDSNGNFIIGA